MVWKILAIAALVTLPLSASLWRKSHAMPEWYRYDVAVDKSLWVYLKDGVCAMRLLSMPTKTAARTAFRAPLTYDPTPNQRDLMLSTTRRGPYRVTWLAFPLWLTTYGLTALMVVPVVRGPVLRRWRRLHGCCVTCGYDLRGCRGHRCSECGTRFR